MPIQTSLRTTFNKPRRMKNVPVISTKALSKTPPLQLTLAPAAAATSPVLSLTEAAVNKANMAVLYDNAGSLKQALDAYNEAIMLLDKVFESADQCMDPARLRQIYASYVGRILILALQCDGSSHDPATWSAPRPSLVTTLHAGESDSPYHQSSGLTSGDSSPTDSVSPSSNTPEKELLRVPFVTGTHFGSIIVKKRPSKDHLKPPDQNSVLPTLSKSTSSLSLKKSSLFRKKRGSKNESRCLPISLSDHKWDSSILPNMDLRHNDDYFGLKSTMEENHMLYSDRKSVLNSMEPRNNNNSNINHPTGHGFYDYGYEIDTVSTAKASLTLSLYPSTSSSLSSKYQPQLTSSASSILTSCSTSPRSVFSSGPVTSSDSDDSSMVSIPLLSSKTSPWPEPKNKDDDTFDKASSTGDPSAPSLAAVWGEIEPDSLSPTTEDTVPTMKTQHLHVLERRPSCLLIRSASSRSTSSTMSKGSPHSGISNGAGLSTQESLDNSTKTFKFWPSKSKIPGAIKIKGVDIAVAMATSTNNIDGKQSNLMTRLQQSMEQGGYITDRIYAPKQLWYQMNVRLPAIESKLSSCEQILKVFQRMHDITRLFHQPHLDQHDITTEAFYLLDKLDRTLDHLKRTCSKSAHGHTSAAEQEGTHHPPDSSAVKQRQRSTIHSLKDPLNTWSTKLSNRIRIEIKSGEDVLQPYVATMVRLFTMASILDQWGMHFRVRTTLGYDELLRRTSLCSETLCRVIGGFVMDDFELLLDKWIKRSREWLLEE